MKRGEIRYCECGCGLAAKRCYSNGKFKSWRAYAVGHAPNELLEIRIPEAATDLAYAAGIIDGEGCIHARVKLMPAGHLNTTMYLQVSMCSEATVSWMHQKFGAEVFIQHRHDLSFNRRPIFTWQVRGKKIAIVLRAVLPYLLERKQRAQFAIELADLISRSRPGRNRKVSEEEQERRRFLAKAITDFNQSRRSEDPVQ